MIDALLKITKNLIMSELVNSTFICLFDTNIRKFKIESLLNNWTYDLGIGVRPIGFI